MLSRAYKIIEMKGLFAFRGFFVRKIFCKKNEIISPNNLIYNTTFDSCYFTVKTFFHQCTRCKILFKSHIEKSFLIKWALK